MPKKVRVVDGPVFLSGAVGKPSLAHQFAAIESEALHAGDAGGPQKRKLSR